jgi:flavodoxin
MESECFHHKNLHLLPSVKTCSIKTVDDRVVHKIGYAKPVDNFSYRYLDSSYEVALKGASYEIAQKFRDSPYDFIEDFRDEFKIPLYEVSETTSVEIINKILSQLVTFFDIFSKRGYAFDFGSKSTKGAEILCKLTFTVNLKGELEYFFQNLLCESKNGRYSRQQSELLKKLLIYFMYRGKLKDKTKEKGQCQNTPCKLRAMCPYFIKYDYWYMHEIICNGNIGILEST